MSYLDQREENEENSRYFISSKALLVNLTNLNNVRDLSHIYFCLEESVKIAYFGTNKKELWYCSKLQDALISELQKKDTEGKYPELKNLENQENSEYKLYRGWRVEGIFGAVQAICGVSKYDEDTCCKGLIIDGKEEKYKELRVFVSEAKRSFLKHLISKVEQGIIKSESTTRV